MIDIPLPLVGTSAILCDFGGNGVSDWIYQNEYDWIVEIDDVPYPITGTLEDMWYSFYDSPDGILYPDTSAGTYSGCILQNAGAVPVKVKVTTTGSLPSQFLDLDGNPTFVQLVNGFEVTLEPSNMGSSVVWTPDGQHVFVTSESPTGVWDSIRMTRQYSFNSANNALTLVDNPALEEFDGDGSYNSGGRVTDISVDGSILVLGNGIIRKVGTDYSSADHTVNGLTISNDKAWIDHFKLIGGNYIEQSITYPSPSPGGLGIGSFSPNYTYRVALNWSYSTELTLQVYTFNNGVPTLLSTTSLTPALGSGATSHSFVWYPNDESRFLVTSSYGGYNVNLLQVHITGSTVSITSLQDTELGADASYFNFPFKHLTDKVVSIVVPSTISGDPAVEQLSQLSGFTFNPITEVSTLTYPRLPLKDFMSIEYPPGIFAGWTNQLAINPVDPNLVAIVCSSGRGFRLYKLVDDAWTFLG